MNPYIPMPVKVRKVVRHSLDNVSLFVDWKEKYAPGQFAQLSILGMGECPISFANYGKEWVEFNVREVGSVTSALSDLAVGDTLYVRGPYGKGYPFEQLYGNNLIFVGGGCGMAPLKGAIEYVEANKEKFKEVWLFMGFRSPEDILFREELKSWELNFHLHMTVDKAKPESCYLGNVGFITEEILSACPDSKDKVIFLCGPPIMMQKTMEILMQKGFHDDQIFLSQERLMYCALGRCGACMIRGKYTCKDGPVFRYDEIKECKTD